MHRDAFAGDVEARLVDLLRARGRVVVSLVALEDDQVVGHVLFSPVTIEGTENGRALGLAPVGVLPQCQRRGVGAQLIREGLVRCGREGYELVVLVGSPEYYSRFGFQAGKPLGLDNEYGVNDEFMVLELCQGALAGKGGMVRYSREFAEV